MGGPKKYGSYGSGSATLLETGSKLCFDLENGHVGGGGHLLAMSVGTEHSHTGHSFNLLSENM